MSKENEVLNSGGRHDKQMLKELQALPLARKVQITQARLIEWLTTWGGNAMCLSAEEKIVQC